MFRNTNRSNSSLANVSATPAFTTNVKRLSDFEVFKFHNHFKQITEAILAVFGANQSSVGFAPSSKAFSIALNLAMAPSLMPLTATSFSTRLIAARRLVRIDSLV